MPTTIATKTVPAQSRRTSDGIAYLHYCHPAGLGPHGTKSAPAEV